jgi:hypothetical protein
VFDLKLNRFSLWGKGATILSLRIPNCRDEKTNSYLSVNPCVPILCTGYITLNQLLPCRRNWWIPFPVSIRFSIHPPHSIITILQVFLQGMPWLYVDLRPANQESVPIKLLYSIWIPEHERPKLSYGNYELNLVVLLVILKTLGISLVFMAADSNISYRSILEPSKFRCSSFIPSRINWRVEHKQVSKITTPRRTNPGRRGMKLTSRTQAGK